MGNLWKFSKDPISRRDHHHWFWGIQISYLRYVNYLQPGLHREKYRTLAVKNFQIWSLTLDPIQSSTIWTYEPLPTYRYLLVESHHSNVRKIMLWLFATLLCWFWTTKYLLGKCYLLFYRNMFNRTDVELPRTNNSIEGWHRSFNVQVSSYHPTFWKFVDNLKREELLTRVQILHCLGGHASPPQRWRYVDSSARILRIVDDYPNREPIYYLQSIAHNLSY